MKYSFLFLMLLFLSISFINWQKPEPEIAGPVSTFENSCANCHGPQGSFYGEKFAVLPDNELHEMVETMMKGPAFLNPSPREIEAMTGYHKALAAKEPFICITGMTKIGQEWMLSGEVSIGATLKIRHKKKSKEVAVSDLGKWNFSVSDTSYLDIIATKNTKTTILHPGQKWKSH